VLSSLVGLLQRDHCLPPWSPARAHCTAAKTRKVEKTVQMSSIAVDCGRRPIGLFCRQRQHCKSAMNKDAKEYGHMDEEIEQAES
jgi:hypothetical protein